MQDELMFGIDKAAKEKKVSHVKKLRDEHKQKLGKTWGNNATQPTTPRRRWPLP